MKAGRWRNLPLTDPDRVHRQDCSNPSDCAHCNWAEMKELWLPQFPLDPEEPTRGSWLELGRDPRTKRPGLGCTCCKRYKVPGKWGRSGVVRGNVTITSLYQHAASLAHQTAVKAFLTDNTDMLCIRGIRPPTVEEFQRLLNAARAGKCRGPEGVDGVGKAKKVRKMLWCVAEGHRAVHRNFLRTCGTISLHQDGRRGRLLLRYRACDSALNVKCGTLGQVSLAKDGGDLGGLGIADGTVKVLKKFCTDFANPPFTSRQCQRDVSKCQPRLDAPLFRLVKRKAEMLDTDAAADEQRAHKVLKHGTRAAPAELPNLKVHNLDKAHSSRRTAVGDELGATPLDACVCVWPRPCAFCACDCVCVCASCARRALPMPCDDDWFTWTSFSACVHPQGNRHTNNSPRPPWGVAGARQCFRSQDRQTSQRTDMSYARHVSQPLSLSALMS